MKKVFVISIVMLFALAMVASAATSQWIAYVAGAGAEGTNGLTIGQLAEGTAGLTDDLASIGIAEPGSASPQPGTYVDVTSQGAYVDVRGLDVPQTWTVNLVGKGGYTGPIGFYIRFANLGGSDVEEFGLAAADWAPAPGLKITFGGSVGLVMDSANATGNGRTIQFANVQGPVTITIGPAEPVVPEPGSMLALGSGLVGLVGFAIRRRK